MLYYDNAATTKVTKEALEQIVKYNSVYYYNAQALYKNASDVNKDLNDARLRIAKLLGVNSNEIIFTGSGTESDNMAILGSRRRKNGNIVISSMEHSAVYYAAMALKSDGYDVRLVPCSSDGSIIENEFIKLIDENTTLVSIIHVCNETGAINNIYKLSQIAKQINKKVVFHSDGVQAFGKLSVKLIGSNIDLYSFGAHKIGGPKGIGGLYIKKGITIHNLMFGGEQENGLRPSTENMGYIMAMTTALESHYQVNRQELYKEMKSKLINTLTSTLGNNIICNSPLDTTIDNIISIAFKNVNGETLMHCLEKHNIIVGIGSACSSKNKGKRIAEALNLPQDFSDGVIRISFGLDSKLEDIDIIANAICVEYNSVIKKER